MSDNITFELKNVDSLLHNMSLLKMTPKESRLYLSRIGRMIVAQTKKNQREQKTVTGSPMKPRSTKSKIRKKMFSKMTKSKYLRVKSSEAYSAYVAFGKADNVAVKHNEGFDFYYDAYDYPIAFDSGKVPTRLNKEIDKDGCTANMAAMLIRLNHLPPHLRKLPAGRAAKIRYIMQNMTRKQALFLIAKGKQKITKRKLCTKIPARPILGVTENQIENFGIEIMNSMCEKFTYKKHKHLLK